MDSTLQNKASGSQHTAPKVETDGFFLLKQTVLSCWNKLFFPIGTLCSALIKQIVLYRRIKLKLVCCRIFVTFSFSFLG